MMTLFKVSIRRPINPVSFLNELFAKYFNVDSKFVGDDVDGLDNDNIMIGLNTIEDSECIYSQIVQGWVKKEMDDYFIFNLAYFLSKELDSEILFGNPLNTDYEFMVCFKDTYRFINLDYSKLV